MAQKLLKTTKRKPTPKKTEGESETGVALVGTYKDRQLAWIRKNGVYNYPVREDDAFDAAQFARISELWLYAGAKARRHAFAATFVGKMTREEFLSAYPTYAKLPTHGASTAKSNKSESSVLIKSENRAYCVFKVTPLDYASRLDNPLVIVRAADFVPRSAKVRKAIEQFKADGEFAPLAAYLPPDLAQVPSPQLRVCEAAVQMDFLLS